MKRPLSRLRLTPRGRLRRNVVLLLLLPLALLLVLRPCFTHQAALELPLRPGGRRPVVPGGGDLRPPL